MVVLLNDTADSPYLTGNARVTINKNLDADGNGIAWGVSHFVIRKAGRAGLTALPLMRRTGSNRRMMRVNSQSTYLAYLLRLWQTKDAGRLVWRASLEDPHTGERKGFSSPEAMVAFLWDQVQKCEREGGEGQKQKKADP